jgi:hypothetical protein
MNARRTFILTGLGLVVALTGCTKRQQAYGEFNADTVWIAMKAVAETPTYDDWKVASNDVWIDEHERRIEIYRLLRRVLYSPDAPPQRGQQSWKLQITMPVVHPPTAQVVSRGFQMPTNATREADRYLREVYTVLIGLPSEQLDPGEGARILEEFGLD